MHHIQQLGCLLDFIDHNCVGFRLGGDALPQPLRPGLEGAQQLRRKQIDSKGQGKHLGQPGGFTCATGTKQEEALGWRLQKTRYNRHLCSQNGVYAANLARNLRFYPDGFFTISRQINGRPLR